jgi:tetratricopeptide (TPR) repeat protein
VISAVPSAAIAVISDYSNLDVAKSGTSRFLLSKYLLSTGDTSSADKLAAEWYELDRYSYLMNAAVDSAAVQDKRELTEIFSECAKRNPLNWAAWSNLGALYLRNGHFDSGLYYLRISDGLNPYNPSTNLNLAYCKFNLREYADAERLLKYAVRIDTTVLTTSVLMLLADIYRESNQQAKYIETFGVIADREDAPSKYIMGWLELLLQRGHYEEADMRIQRALGRQIDSQYVRTLQSRFPQLRSK